MREQSLILTSLTPPPRGKGKARPAALIAASKALALMKEDIREQPLRFGLLKIESAVLESS